MNDWETKLFEKLEGQLEKNWGHQHELERGLSELKTEIKVMKVQLMIGVAIFTTAGGVIIQFIMGKVLGE